MKSALLFSMALAAAGAPAQVTPQVPLEPPTAAASSASQPAPASTPAAAPLSPAEARALTYKIYTAAFRINDLLGTLDSSRWKMDDAARQTFDRTVASVRSGFEELDKSRMDFYNRPDNLEAGEATDASVTALLPDVDALAQAVAQYAGSQSAGEFSQPASELASLQQSLKAYVAFLKNPTPVAPPGGPAGVQTEIVRAPRSSGPPLTRKTITEGPGYIAPAEVKALLHAVYMQSYRVGDLLSTAQPEKWKLSDSQRTEFQKEAAALRAGLGEVDRWRAQLNEHTDSMYFGYQTYAALNSFRSAIDGVAGALARLGQQALGAQYRDPEAKLGALDETLSAYVGYLLLNQHQIVSSLEDNLSSCQSTLGYAMRPRAEVAIPMRNVMPEFKGHPRKSRHARGRKDKTRKS